MMESIILENPISIENQNENELQRTSEVSIEQKIPPFVAEGMSPIIQINSDSTRQKRTSFFKITNKLVFVLFVLLLFGAFLGGLLSPYVKSAEIGFLADSFLDSRQNQEFSSIFWASLWGNLLILGAIFLLAFSAISAPVLFLTTVFKGMGVGVSVGFLYISEGFQGLYKAVLFIIPGGFFSSIMVVLAVNIAIRFSRDLLKTLINNASSTEKNLIKENAIGSMAFKFGVFIVFAVGCAAVDGAASILFRGLFA